MSRFGGNWKVVLGKIEDSCEMLRRGSREATAIEGATHKKWKKEIAMLNYATVGSNKIEEAKVFYDALLGLIGMSPFLEQQTGGRIYASADHRMFGVLGPFDGKPATVGNGSMFGFMLDSREEVSAFHAKALELGGTCEGPPGLRGAADDGTFVAYVRDLDGNKLCAMTFK